MEALILPWNVPVAGMYSQYRKNSGVASDKYHHFDECAI